MTEIHIDQLKILDRIFVIPNLMSEIEYEEKNLVKTKNGTLPVLLTYHHNSTKQPYVILERSDTNLPDGCAKIPV